MFRYGGMDDVGAARARHMAAHAVVVAAPFQPDGRREATALIGVALQAAPPVVGDLLTGFGQPMRIVAGCASQRALARAEAAALVHLLDLANEPLLGRPADCVEHGPELMERQTRPVILVPAVESQNPLMAVQVTLLANRIPQRGLEGIRVDDRHVLAVDLCRTPNVQLARPVAPFAADGIAPEDRLLIPVDRARHWIELVRVAEQALRATGRLKCRFLFS